LALFWRNHNFTKTAIVSERPQFFFEINESWYYILNLYQFCIEGKNQKTKSQGQRDGSNLLIQYILWGPYEWSGPPDRDVRGCLATAL